MQSTDSSYIVPPFPAFPSTSRYIPLGSVQDALGRVCRSIDAREAVSMVVGPPGTGKSLICGLLVEHYRDSHEVVVLGETPIENKAAFLRHLLHHLGADLSKIPDGDLQLALIDRVCGKDAPEGGLLIIVDEAQSLSTEVIESIRMVTNIMRDGEPRVIAVLCGGVKLDETLVEASMEAFTQRVATRCYLHPMNGEETRRYVMETIRNCGAEPDETISTEAIAAVHHACSGVPRLINQILTQAIDCAEEEDQAEITVRIVDLAWAHLQQLPSPMIEEPKISRDTNPIEFGELDDSVNFAEWTPTETPSSELSHSPQQRQCETGNCESGECETGNCETGECETGEFQTSECDSEVAEVVVGTDADIEFNGSSAQWVEEEATESAGSIDSESSACDSIPCDIPACELVSEVESPTALFGHFDEEEDLSVGSGFAPAAANTSTAPPADLEVMLHQELVGINPDTTGLDFADSTLSDDSVAHDLDDEQEERVEDFITVVDDEPQSEPASDNNPVLWAPEAPAGEDCVDDMELSDDSDILVIEDEVELRRVDAAARVDSQDQTISVDFQAMLNRMRSGN